MRWPVLYVSAIKPVRWLCRVIAPCGHVPQTGILFARYGSVSLAAARGGPVHETTSLGLAHSTSFEYNVTHRLKSYVSEEEEQIGEHGLGLGCAVRYSDPALRHLQGILDLSQFPILQLPMRIK